MEHLPLCKTAYIVQTRVIVHAIAAIALHTSAWLMLAFEDSHMKTFL
jgi:hypothetical protein